MFCTKCGVELRDQDKFCFDCGASTGRAAPPPRPQEQLSRPMHEAKIAGVCAGFARYFALDVTLVRVVWVVLSVWPVPMFGLIAYIVAWIVMPKDPVTVPARQMQQTT
jgi:phage shock protein C